MAELLNKFEFIIGKGGSIQGLYKYRIYNKFMGIKYKCCSCPSVLSINPTLLNVSKESTWQSLAEYLEYTLTNEGVLALYLIIRIIVTELLSGCLTRMACESLKKIVLLLSKFLLILIKKSILRNMFMSHVYFVEKLQEMDFN